MVKLKQIYRGIKGFTLVEMLVTLALLAIVASVTGVICLKARSRSRALVCLDNQREISTALVAHYQDHREFPADGSNANLALALQDYIPWAYGNRQVALPGVYRCRNDRSGALSNSYEPFYVRRRQFESGDFFVLGCPRHTDADATYLNMLGVRGGVRGAQGTILINGGEVLAEAPTSERTVSSGTIAFDDGSQLEVTNTSPDYEVVAVASFRQEDGRLYTVVRVNGSGQTSFKVTPGSKFEVVTPVAIIGVRGTQFVVSTDTDYANVSVSKGVVHVWDKIDEKTYLLEAGEQAEIGEPASNPLILEPDVERSGYWTVLNEGDDTIEFYVFARDVSAAEDDWYWMDKRNVGAGETVTLCHPTAAAIKIVYTLPDGVECVEISERSGTNDPLSENIEITGPYILGKYVKYRVTNNNVTNVRIDRLEYQWNAVAGDLDDVYQDGRKIYKTNIAPDTAIISSGWYGDDDRRKIAAKDGKYLVFEHDRITSLDPNSYALSVHVIEDDDDD